jgi:hypothetical protein
MFPHKTTSVRFADDGLKLPTLKPSNEGSEDRPPLAKRFATVDFRSPGSRTNAEIRSPARGAAKAREAAAAEVEAAEHAKIPQPPSQMSRQQDRSSSSSPSRTSFFGRQPSPSPRMPWQHTHGFLGPEPPRSGAPSNCAASHQGIPVADALPRKSETPQEPDLLYPKSAQMTAQPSVAKRNGFQGPERVADLMSFGLHIDVLPKHVSKVCMCVLLKRTKCSKKTRSRVVWLSCVCVCVCVCVCMCVCVFRMCVCAYVHVHAHVYIHACMCIRIPRIPAELTFLDKYTHTHTHTRIHAFIHT